MKIIVVGLGSMGRRRIRLLKQICSDYLITGVDSNIERCKQAREEFLIETRTDLSSALEEICPDCAIVSTSPVSHADIIENCLKHNCHVFTELNLVADKYDSNIMLAKERGKVLFLSSTFLYRDEIKYISEQVRKIRCKLNYNYHVGQYLPDWHPWESIKDYFVGDKRTNGCRELFAIELPWLIKAFGEIDEIKMISGRNSDLPIDYNDNYMLIINHKSGNKGALCLDVISRKAVRNLEVYGEDLYLTWDGTPTGLVKYDFDNRKEQNINLYESVDKQDSYAAFVIENAYKNELVEFIESTKSGAQTLYTFEDDKKTLSLIDRIESGELQ